MSKSVFPYTLPCGSIVIDERCVCSARRSEHNYRNGIAWGHGDCARTECERFTWESFIYKPDDCEPISGTPISEDDAECAGGCEEHYLYCNCEPTEYDSPNEREGDNK